MSDLLTRFVVSLETIAEALTNIASTEREVTGLPSRIDMEPPTHEEDEQPTRRRRRTKAEMEAARAAEASTPAPVQAQPPKAEVVQASPAQDAAPVVSQSAAKFDYALLKAAVIKLAQAFGPEGKNEAVSILASYKVSNASQAPEALWPEMYAKFQAAIAKREKPAEDDFA